MKISNKVADGVSNLVQTDPLALFKKKSKDIDNDEEQMTIFKPEELEIDIETFKAIPELKDVQDEFDEDDETVMKRDKGYEFIMDEIAKVYKDDVM